MVAKGLLVALYRNGDLTPLLYLIEGAIGPGTSRNRDNTKQKDYYFAAHGILSASVTDIIRV
jgi:hypothetical protein